MRVREDVEEFFLQTTELAGQRPGWNETHLQEERHVRKTLPWLDELIQKKMRFWIRAVAAEREVKLMNIFDGKINWNL